MNNWDLNELKFLVFAMDYVPEDKNPNMFLDFESANLDQFKNYYIQNKDV